MKRIGVVRNILIGMFLVMIFFIFNKIENVLLKSFLEAILATIILGGLIAVIYVKKKDY